MCKFVMFGVGAGGWGNYDITKLALHNSTIKSKIIVDVILTKRFGLIEFHKIVKCVKI